MKFYCHSTTKVLIIKYKIDQKMEVPTHTQNSQSQKLNRKLSEQTSKSN